MARRPVAAPASGREARRGLTVALVLLLLLAAWRLLADRWPGA